MAASPPIADIVRLPPGARKRAAMERERIEREAERLRLKRLPLYTLWRCGTRLLLRVGGPSSIPALGPRWLQSATGCMSSARNVSRCAEQTSARSTFIPMLQLDCCAGHVLQTLFAASAIRQTARCDKAIMGRPWKRQRKRIIERVETDEVGWGQRQIAAVKKKKR